MCTAQMLPGVQVFFTVIFLLLIVLASVQFTSWELGTDIEIIVTDSPGIFCLLRILRLWEWKITDWYSASAWKSAFVYETNSTYRMQIDKEASRLCFVYQVHTNVSFLYPSDIQCKIWFRRRICIGKLYRYNLPICYLYRYCSYLYWLKLSDMYGYWYWYEYRDVYRYRIELSARYWYPY